MWYTGNRIKGSNPFISARNIEHSGAIPRDVLFHPVSGDLMLIFLLLCDIIPGQVGYVAHATFFYFVPCIHGIFYNREKYLRCKSVIMVYSS